MTEEDLIRRSAHRKLQLTALIIAMGLLSLPSLIGSMTKTGSRAEAHPIVRVIVE
jgi:hypothetical protein